LRLVSNGPVKNEVIGTRRSPLGPTATTSAPSAIVGWIAVGQVAADRREVPHERIGDYLRGVVEQWIARPDELGFLELGFAGQRADAEEAVVLADPRQTRDPVDVHEVGRACEAELHQGDETLASGEDLGVFAELGQEGCRFIDRARCVVLEGGRNHRGPLPGQPSPETERTLPSGAGRVKPAAR